MNPAQQKLLWAYELHSVGEIAAAFDAGVSAADDIDGTSPATHLLEMYTRSPRFSECLALVLERGGRLDDPLLAPVLLNDADGVRRALEADSSFVEHRSSIDCTFTPLKGATPLHFAAEYGHVDAARVLLEGGADVNATAAADEDGMNGHTPLFHTVNSHRNLSLPVMELLLEHGADPNLRLAGITWGRGYEWETTCFDVTPVSYAQLGLLPQMQRKEADVYEAIERLLEAGGRPTAPVRNVPNRYLQDADAK